MARKTDLEVRIDANGNVQVRVRGVKGPGCLEFVKLVEQALGTVVSQELTSEYHEQADVEVERTVERRTKRE